MVRGLCEEDNIANVLLVKEIEKYPCLYNNKSKEYSKRDAVDAAWSKVAAVAADKVENCKFKWRNLRTVFMRKQKELCGRKNRKPYYLNDCMQFIKPFIKVQKHSTASQSIEYEVSHCADRNESEEELFVSSALVNGKRKRKQEQYSRKLLLLSILPEVENLNQTQFKIFRRSLLDALDYAGSYTDSMMNICTESSTSVPHAVDASTETFTFPFNARNIKEETQAN